ncbi:MAG: hypothetical protein WEB53_14850 [Akkermansiaceae bacterium]
MPGGPLATAADTKCSKSVSASNSGASWSIKSAFGQISCNGSFRVFRMCCTRPGSSALLALKRPFLDGGV